MSTKAEALKQARAARAQIRKVAPKLARALKIDVWQNCGWHWCLAAKDFGLWPGGLGKFWILAGPNSEGHAGRPRWGLEDNPQAAFVHVKVLLKAVLRLAEQETAELQAAVDRMRALLA